MQDSTTNEAPVTYIYALIDPITNEVRYIGKADNPAIRLRRHLRHPEINCRNRKANWLRKLLASGHHPILAIVETVMKSQWQEAERKWIAHYRAIGTNLTNSTSGGEGIDKGAKHSDEAKRKISIASKGHVKSLETRKRLSIALTGKKMPQSSIHKAVEARKKQWESLDEDTKTARTQTLRHGWPEELRKKASETHRGKKKKPGQSISKYVGVSWFKANERWRAYTYFDGRQKHLGYFDTELEAAIAYNKAVLEIWGDSAKLNVIAEK